MSIEFHIPKLHWPKWDPHLQRYTEDKRLEQHNSPLFTPSFWDLKNLEELSYLRTYPKFIIRAFRSKNTSSGIKETFGLVYFSSKCLGAPGLCHGGALSTVVDTLGSDLAIGKSGTHIYYTRKITIKFKSFVRLESVVRFECKFVNPTNLPIHQSDKYALVKLVDVNSSVILVECLCNLALGGELQYNYLDSVKNTKKCDWEERWDKQIDSIKVAAKINDLWGEEAEKRCQKILVCSPVSMTLANIERDFPTTIGLTDTMPNLYNNPPHQIFWDFSPTKTPFVDISDIKLLPEFQNHPPKIRRKLFWRNVNASKGINVPMESRVVVGIYIFSPLCTGPPGRAHGGSIATAFDDAQGALVVRERGFLPAHNTVDLVVEYKGAIRLMEANVMICRLVDFDETSCHTEAILLGVKEFFQLKDPFSNIWTQKIKTRARSTAKWKRPTTNTEGLGKVLDYDEAYAYSRSSGKLWASAESQWRHTKSKI